MTKAQIGVYGLGTMGSALALNMAEKGFRVAVTNRETAWIGDFMAEAGDLAGNLHPHEALEDFVAGLVTPRVILFMIPSGRPMDLMIEAIAPLAWRRGIRSSTGAMRISTRPAHARPLWPRRTFISSAWGCRAAKKVRVMARR